MSGRTRARIEPGTIKMSLIYRVIPISDDAVLFEVGFRFRLRTEKRKWSRKLDFMLPSFIDVGDYP